MPGPVLSVPWLLHVKPASQPLRLPLLVAPGPLAGPLDRCVRWPVRRLPLCDRQATQAMMEPMKRTGMMTAIAMMADCGMPVPDATEAPSVSQSKVNEAVAGLTVEEVTMVDMVVGVAMEGGLKTEALQAMYDTGSSTEEPKACRGKTAELPFAEQTRTDGGTN